MVTKSYNRKYQNIKSQKLKKCRSEARREFSRFVSRAVNIIKMDTSTALSFRQKRFHSIIRGLSTIWLAEKLNIHAKECRFSSLSNTKCRKTVRLCADARPQELADWVTRKIISYKKHPTKPEADNVTLIIVRKEYAASQAVSNE